MRHLLLLLLLPLLSGCDYSPGKTYYDQAGDSASWRRLDFGPFSVSAPGDWVRYDLQGTDSYIGGMGNGKLMIYQSLKFRNSHHGKTDSLYMGRFSGDFPISAENGKAIFYQNCGACHSRYKVITGPALTPGFLRERSNEWVYRFLTHRSTMKRDSLHLAIWYAFNKIDCQFFDSAALTRRDVDQIMEWLREDQQYTGY